MSTKRSLTLFTLNVIILQYLLIFTKNIITYTEELFLFTTYMLLFVVIFELTAVAIKTGVIKKSFNLVEFYEKLIYLKLILILKLNNMYRTLLNKEFILYYIKKINIFFTNKVFRLNTIITKIKNNLLFLYLNYYSIQSIKIQSEINKGIK